MSETVTYPTAEEINAQIKTFKLAKVEPKPLELTPQDIEALVSIGVVPPGTPEATIRLYGKVCGETRLSPFKRQIYIIKRWSKQGDRYTLQTGIDGFRAIAEDTGAYAGSDDAVYDSEDKPNKATVSVWKIVSGVRCPFTATARWDQYYPGDQQGFMWNKMPHLMLAKCAEALALRKAFPSRLSGLYTHEEMAQAGDQPALTEAAMVTPGKDPQKAPDAAAGQPDPKEVPSLTAKNIPVTMIQAFRDVLGIGYDQLKSYLGRELENLTDVEMDDMRALFDEVLAAKEAGKPHKIAFEFLLKDRLASLIPEAPKPVSKIAPNQKAKKAKK
jgi:phage recombination protein Bet